MFALLPLVSALAGSAAQLPSGSANLCGGADLLRGKVMMTLNIFDAPAKIHSPSVIVRSPNADKSYSLSAFYRPTEQGLGQPHMVYVDALIAFASDLEARPVRFQFRKPGEGWLTPASWTTPQRSSSSTDARFRADHRMGQGEPHPHDQDVLDDVARGVTYEFRNLDEAGKVVSTGLTEYPSEQVIEEMYATAKRQAMARLRPCATGYGPPIVPTVRPAPKP